MSSAQQTNFQTGEQSSYQSSLNIYITLRNVQNCLNFSSKFNILIYSLAQKFKKNKECIITEKPLKTLFRKCYQHFDSHCSLKYRFKQSQNARVSVLVFIYLSAALNRFKSRQNACFRYIAFIYFFAIPNRLKYHHNACFRDIVFIFPTAAPNCFKNCQNAPFTVLVFFSFFSAV